MQHTILLVEDDAQLRTLLTFFLEKSGFKVLPAENGHEALNIFGSQNIDLIYSDVLMPLINGWDFVRTVRETSDVPIIMVTALANTEDQLKGLQMSVNDYLVKPVHPDILVAKIKNCLKFYSNRPKKIIEDDSQLLSGNLAINQKSRTVKINEEFITLSKTEFDLLWLFIKNSEKVLSRQEIINSVWPYQSFVDPRVVDTFVKALRKKLGIMGKNIETAYGVGYKWQE